MKVITTISTKGGSGKTTLNQLLISAAIEKGQRVHVLDADTDRQILEWQDKSAGADWSGLERADWPKSLTVSEPPSDIDELYELLNKWDSEGVDLTLIDTRPGEYEETVHFSMAAHAVLVPVAPKQSDFVPAFKTLEWIQKMLGALPEDYDPPAVSCVLMNAPPEALNYLTAEEGQSPKVHNHDREVFDSITALPLLDTPIPTSKIIQRMPLLGPIGMCMETYASDPRRRLQIGHYKAALDIACALYDDVNQLIGEDDG